MQAGLLRELITFYGETTTRTDTGAVKKETAQLITTRCYRMKKRASLAMAGDEEINTGTVTVQVRYNPIMDGATTFEYENITYRITQRLKQIKDNTLIVEGLKKQN